MPTSHGHEGALADSRFADNDQGLINEALCSEQLPTQNLEFRV